MIARAVCVWLVLAWSVVAPPLVSAQVVAPASIPETLVMPFDSAAEDPSREWLSEASAVLLAEQLERYGGRAVPRPHRVRAFERLQLPPATSLSHATIIKVGQFVGATDVVLGHFDIRGDQLLVRARVLLLEAGRLLPEVVEQGPLSDLFAVYDRLARRLRGASVPAPAALPGTLLSSLHGFEAFVKGLLADAPDSQRAYLQQALTAAPADDRIRLALWRVHTDAAQHQQALAIASAVPGSSLRAPEARYLVAYSSIQMKRFDEAFTMLKALQSTHPSVHVLNALGVVQVRRGGGTAQSGRAVYFFTQATQLDPTDADAFFNLGYAYWLDRDPQAAIYWLREAVRRDPADGDAHNVLAQALQQSGAVTEAARERELAQRLSASYTEHTGRSAPSEPVGRGLERLPDGLDRPMSRVDAVIASSGQRDHAELARHHLDAGRRAFEREADREAAQELRRALYLSPYLADAHLLIGRVHLRAGRTSEAMQAFKIALWSAPTVAAHLALAEGYLAMKNVAAARDEVTRALALDPTSASALALRDKIAR